MLLHGFTQSASSLEPLASMIGERTVLRVDLPGHGASSDVSADLDAAAAMVADLAEGERFDVVGYSLGGRVALHVACATPPGLRRVVTIGASAGIADDDARAARLERDVATANALESGGDVASFISRWLANPMFATLPPERADVSGRLRNSAAGLADSLRRCSLGAQRWLMPELARLECPTLMVAGARDDPFVAQACAVARASSAVAAVSVPGAGHACHLEQPAVAARLIARFLDET